MLWPEAREAALLSALAAAVQRCRCPTHFPEYFGTRILLGRKMIANEVAATDSRQLMFQSYESDDHSSECSSLAGVARSSSDADNPLKLRECAIKRAAGIKGQKMCCYQLCPSPLHSKKWRLVTPGTSAGARDWNPLVGQTLCDSCYSTYRKHGTFIRSVRTTEGWIRVDSTGAQADTVCIASDKPKKSPATAKRSRLPDADTPHKRMKPAAMDDHFTEDQVTQCFSLQSLSCLRRRL